VDDQDDRGYSRAPELEDLVSLCKALNDEGLTVVDDVARSANTTTATL
jgi:hypothetical protein